ncbi:MAG TPA: response regulator, partial [Candidatus Eisenbacteria bacterium]|nr:response regulator [Candidatus Eisenbacteria bacterium]
MPETRILLVDDEDSFRTITARELQRVGYAVDTAGTLEQARAALAGRSYHLVLLDVRLPDGSGLELLEDIRSSLPATQVVMLTAYGTVQEAIQAMRKGAHDFLSKPCKLGELEVVLERALEVSHLERGN